ncbi:transglutaminase superfamily protein [Nitrospirillum pindoramense]|uniref:Transglutaminase superfamily protein n=1 Tax=Nitrospirillum amazonense TaxID=28077 RepID=A0A560HAL4_9PROT|nr:transglutaminase superfamily protein [Nitrospirillum amazonense]
MTCGPRLLDGGLFLTAFKARRAFSFSRALLAATVLAPCWSAARAADLPIETVLSTEDIVVQKDGTSVATDHFEILAKTDAAAHAIGQFPLSFSEAMEGLDIDEAYTLKPDGRKLPIDVTAIQAQLPHGSPNIPMYNDQRQKVLIFPDLAAGDTIVATVRRQLKKPFFPGEVLHGSFFSTTVTIRDAHGSLSLPKGMPLYMDTEGMTLSQEEQGDRVLYRWRYANLTPLTEDIALLAPTDRNPRYFATTFKDYDSFAAAYAKLSAPAEQVTPKIQEQADSITAGVTDRRQQAERIYAWVSSHIRYVGLELGQGSVIPHAADAVLANGYGDCKDHAVLFGALLKAKGIASEVVLINGSNGYTLPKHPSLLPLNHAITWLPEFKLYADTTAGVAPFGVLPFPEYGKPVVHATTAGHALRQVPVLAAGSGTQVSATAKLGADGALTGQTVTTATGPFAVILRQMAQGIQAQGPEQAASAQLQSLGTPGTGKFTLATAPTDLAPSYSVSGSFAADPMPERLTGAGFAMPGGLRLFNPVGNFLMGILALPRMKDTEPTPCYTGHTAEDLSLELPAGYHLTALPKDATITTDTLKYTAHWAQEGQVVRLRRDFDAHIDQALCTGDVRKAAAKALLAIAADHRATLTLAADAASTH